MNKIILFVIILIIGSVLSTGMMEAPKEKVSETTFDCTIKSIQVCGTNDNVCLTEYMKKCQKSPTSANTINVSHANYHKTHHTYKTSIIVKENSYDDEEEDDSRRICITDTNCNCKDIAKTNCEKSEDGNCYDSNLKACQTRCKESRRCYRMDCKNAGVNRCTTNVQLECALKHPDSSDKRIECVQKNSECCQRYESATCKRALRVYKYRTECNDESQTKCHGITDAGEKCNCVTKTRHTCLVNKVESYRQSVRRVFDCEESSNIICSEKKCGSDYDLCVKRQKSICEPVCHKESRQQCNNQINGECYQESYKKCIHKWKKTYCEKRAQIKCGEDDDCLRSEKHHCKRDIPSCMTGEVSCDDKNKCTEDICHPTQGCINKPINCDDKNACTTESCHPVLGCVYKTKKCDDGKLCTRDSCNPVSGECKFVYDNTICHVCGNGYCEKDLDCSAWEKAAKLGESCQRAVCNAQYGSCQAVHLKGCAHKCRRSCAPYHACDTATCVLNEKIGEYECVHTEKDCNDHKSCTIDTCDKTLGCQHNFNKECPSNPICEVENDCLKWETSNDLRNKCQKAVCDKHKGICLAVSTSQECDEPICKKSCQPRHSCETSTCVKNKNGRFHCARQPIICDDKKDCTVDSCDNVLGCVFKYKVTEVCKPGLQCVHSADCKKYELSAKLADQCLKSICDAKLGTCVTAPIDGDCDKKLKECELSCKSTNQCQENRCVKDEGNRYVCQPTAKNCDDGKSCTVDSCDNLLGCVHKYQPDEVNCPLGGQCKRDADCVTWGFTQKLGRQCKRPVCDITTGACKAVAKVKKCIPPTECNLSCKSQNACETATCELNEEGDYYCKRISKICSDNNECTLNSCELTTGKCVFTQIQSEKCSAIKCTKQSDCDALNQKVADDCKSAVCDTTTQTCKVAPTNDQKCEDRKVCRRTCVANACETATCVYNENLRKHSCVRTKSTDKSCVDKKSECELSCKPANACETTSCAQQTDGSYTCLRSVNTCNDNKSCTKDSCDTATGKCVNTYVVSEKCEQNAYCEKNLDCAKWASNKELDICLTPVCDTESGSCKAVPNTNKCSTRTCVKQCPPRNSCEESTCYYDRTTKKLACEYKRKSCDDANKCTVDSCDETKGCLHTFDKTVPGCDTPRCETPKDCIKYSEDNKLSDDCKEAICDSETKTCRAVLINNNKCNPYLNKCKRECAARTSCETAECIVDANTKRYRCLRKPITCNDNNDCTVDVCDPVKGCKYTYTVSDKCEQFCNDNNDCTSYGLKKQASLTCQVPYCDKATSSCKLQDDTNKNCKRIDVRCQNECKPKDACNNARCIRKGDNDFTCTQEPIKCDDGQDCTEDSCDTTKGCVFKFKESTTCKKQCKVDIDCDNWAVTEKLADKCQKARCSRKLGSCVAVRGPQTEKCRTTDECKVTTDCPQGKFGSVCCEDNGLKKCCDNQCETDLDCVPKDKVKEWGYCKIRDSGKRECEYKPKCKGNEDCDDKNPCTKDVCLTEYGFCKNIRRCVDNTACTHDICVPGTDGKSFTCKNPTKTCTNDKTLLDKNYDKLNPTQKTKWIGKCSHLEGCVTCVVNAQCDDNNGCTEDSCINQFCISKPIDNKWCDPKLEGQAITVQGYFPKFTRI